MSGEGLSAAPNGGSRVHGTHVRFVTEPGAGRPARLS
jgi:hypothetical protein